MPLTLFISVSALYRGGGAMLAACLLYLLLRALWEPTALECRTVRLALPEPASPGGRPASARPLRLLLLSDLHFEHFRVRPERLIQACAAAEPDLVLFAGDLTGRDRCLPAALDLMRQIRGLPALQDCSFAAVRGNHDSEETAAGLRQLGITVLENAVWPVLLQGQSWLVIGLQDLRTGRPDAAMVMAQADATGIPAGRRLVLAHNPDSLLDLPPGSAAAFFAGHFHGGQIWLPFHLEFYLLRSEKLPRRGHRKGLFTWRGTPAYISRGLGCVSLPLRLFSRPELTVFEISPGGAR